MPLSNVKTKLALGAAVALVTGTVGLLSLGTVHAVGAGSAPTNKEQCKNDGWKQFKSPDGKSLFKAEADCISYVTAHDSAGNGYGGSNGNTINANVNINLHNSNNNVINIIIRLVLGG